MAFTVAPTGSIETHPNANPLLPNLFRWDSSHRAEVPDVTRKRRPAPRVSLDQGARSAPRPQAPNEHSENQGPSALPRVRAT